jgi:RHS repeat-associated protein
VGNLLSMQHRGTDPANPGWSRAYGYNETSQLDIGQQSNRLTSTAIGGIMERYSALGDGYDPHGNMLRMPHLQVMQWDFKDQLQMTQRQKVNDEDADGVAHHGQRARKVTEGANDAGPKDERIYLGGFEIYRRHSGPDAGLLRETLHIMNDKQRIALVETRNDVDDGSAKQLTRYQFGNRLDSASLELDEQGQIISYEEYAPFGSSTYQAVRSQTETPKRYRYTGKERDDESGLFYHVARYYAPWLGRWISPDPAGTPFDGALYAYVSGNPTNRVDPLGAREKRVEQANEGLTPIINVGGQEIPVTLEEMSKAMRAEEDVGKPLEESGREIVSERGSFLLPKNLPEVTLPAGFPEKYQKYFRGFNREKPQPHTAFPDPGEVIVNAAVLFPFEPVLSLMSLTEPGAGERVEEFRQWLRPFPYKEGAASAGRFMEALYTSLSLMGLGLAQSASKAALVTGSRPLLAEATASLDEAVVANRAAWRELTAGNPSASRIFEVGTDLAGVNELAIIEHGAARDRAAMSLGEVGAETVAVSGVGRVGPNTLAELMVQSGWRGGQLRLIACSTGMASEQGITFGEQLSIGLAARGAPTVVAAPRGLVTVGAEFFGTPTAAPIVVSPRVGIGVGAFRYWGP